MFRQSSDIYFGTERVSTIEIKLRTLALSSPQVQFPFPVTCGEYVSHVKYTRRLFSINEATGFPGTIGSIDYMYWQCNNCQFRCHGHYSGHAEGCNVILEIVALHDLWT
jgi:hypothetical protein